MSEPLPQPYIGLRPFSAGDAALFYGREAQVVSLLRRLEDRRFVAVIGASGSGKSSLIRAGLLPAIDDGFLFGRSDWLTLIIRPGSQPYARLAECLAGALPQASPAADAVPAWQAALRRSDRGFIDVCAAAVAPERHVLLVVDQFEELFGFRRLNTAKETLASRDEAAAFTSLLLHSCADPEGRISVVLAMRSDFSGDCDAFLGLPEAISASQFLVPRLNRWQMEEAIVAPSRAEGQGFAPFEFEHGLINRIINEASDRPDQLPLMQHALMQTWKVASRRCAAAAQPVVLMEADYDLAGGVEQALSRHADAAFQEFSADPMGAAVGRRLFLLLSDIAADGQLVRRRATVRELLECTGAGLPLVAAVVAAFNADDRNFIVVMPEGPLAPGSVLDICHEALLRRWDLFANTWLVQERNDVIELRRLAEQAESRASTGLLPSGVLGRVEAWAARVTAPWAVRYVSAATYGQIAALIDDSRKAADDAEREASRQRRRLQLWKRLALLAVLVTAAVFGWMAHDARTAQGTLENALTDSYVRVIGLSPQLSNGEAAALWELAARGSSSRNLRGKVIDRFFESDSAGFQAVNRNDAGMVAVTGLNGELLDYAGQRVTRLVNQYWRDAGPDPAGADTQRLINIGWIVVQLGQLYDQPTLETTAEHLLTALQSSSITSDQRNVIVTQFVAVTRFVQDHGKATKLQRQAAEWLSGQVTAGTPTEIGPVGALGALADLAAAAPETVQAAAGAAAERMAQEDWVPAGAGTESSTQQAAFARILATLQPGAARDALAEKFATAIQLLDAYPGYDYLYYAVHEAPTKPALDSVIDSMSAQARKQWATRNFELMLSVTPPRSRLYDSYGYNVFNVATLAAAQLDATEARKVADRAVELVKARNVYVGPVFSEAIARLLPKIEGPRQTDIADLIGGKLAAQFPPPVAAPVVTPARGEPSGGFWSTSSAIEGPLSGIAIYMTPSVKTRMAETRANRLVQDLERLTEPAAVWSSNVPGPGNVAALPPPGAGSAAALGPTLPGPGAGFANGSGNATVSAAASVPALKPTPVDVTLNVALWLPLLGDPPAQALAARIMRALAEPQPAAVTERNPSATLPFESLVAIAQRMGPVERLARYAAIMQGGVQDPQRSASQAGSAAFVASALVAAMPPGDIDVVAAHFADDLTRAPSSRVAMVVEPMIVDLRRMTRTGRDLKTLEMSMLVAIETVMKRSDAGGPDQLLALGRLTAQVADLAYGVEHAAAQQARLAALSLMLGSQPAQSVINTDEVYGLLRGLDRQGAISVLKWPFGWLDLRRRIFAQLGVTVPGAADDSASAGLWGFAKSAQGEDRRALDLPLTRPDLQKAVYALEGR